MTSNGPTLSATGRGILLVGHGTRDERGQQEFHQTADMLRARLPCVPVEACFLELAAPDIEAGVRALTRANVKQIIVAPVLLFAAGHAKADIPSAVEEAVDRDAREDSDGLGGPSYEIRWAQPLDCHEKILELSARRFREALAGAGAADTSPEDTLLILVGRGASDEEAIQRVHQFAALRAELTPVRRCIVGFLAVASPRLEATLDIAQQSKVGHVVVQPHLLFQGRLADEVQQRVIQLNGQRRAGDPKWHFASHLGPSPELADALLERIHQAVSSD